MKSLKPSLKGKASRTTAISRRPEAEPTSFSSPLVPDLGERRGVLSRTSRGVRQSLDLTVIWCSDVETSQPALPYVSVRVVMERHQDLCGYRSVCTFSMLGEGAGRRGRGSRKPTSSFHRLRILKLRFGQLSAGRRLSPTCTFPSRRRPASLLLFPPTLLCCGGL